MQLTAMSSTEFRRRFASLRGEVLVTVNGHPIGIWTPSNVMVDLGRDTLTESKLTQQAAKELVQEFAQFRPAPKPSQRHG